MHAGDMVVLDLYLAAAVLYFEGCAQQSFRVGPGGHVRGGLVLLVRGSNPEMAEPQDNACSAAGLAPSLRFIKSLTRSPPSAGFFISENEC